MKTKLLLILLLTSLKAMATVNMEALIHEQFQAVNDQGFGSQGGLIIGRRISDAGMTSQNLSIRMAMQNSNASRVYLPPMRTPTNDLERFLVRTHHSHSKAVMRPILVKDLGLMMSERISSPNPENTSVWFETYFTSLYPYAALADKFDISEFVLATGMGKLWDVNNAQAWIDLQSKIARRLKGVPLSIEITSQEDFNTLDRWRKLSPQTFNKFFENISVIRFQIADRLPNDLVDWKKSTLAKAFIDGLDQARKQFPQQKLKIASLTVPACDLFNIDNEHYECMTGEWNHTAQKSALNELMLALDSLTEAQIKNLRAIEFNAGVSEFEPEGTKKDSRFINYTPDFQLFFKALKARTKIWQPPVSSPVTGAIMKLNASKMACIYYNGAVGDASPMGEIHGQLLVNLVGAFPAWQSSMRDIATYKSGDLDTCEVGFYIATNYFYQPNVNFLTDLSTYIQKKTFVWFNYKFDSFQLTYSELQASAKLDPFEFTYVNISKPEVPFTPNNLNMGFFRYFDYKGETFEKLAKWNFNTNAFMADPEMGIVKLADSSPNTKILAVARHSTDGTTTPYVTQQKFSKGGSVFYFGDTPFSFVHYEDRYLILCDLMWDIMGEKAPTELRALVRLEDIDGKANPDNMRWVIDYLADQNIPFAIATIPIYSSVFGYVDGFGVEPEWTSIAKFPEVAGILRYAKSRGGDFIMHGVSHQGGDHICGYDGNSGDDFEFWMYPENTPMPEDSVDFVTNLLDQGEQAFNELGIKPLAWETPHYANSALDSVIFGRTFSWSYHRSIYFPIKKLYYPPREESKHYFNCATAECKQKQKDYLNKIQIEVDERTFSGQIFPYPVYRDVYGQRIIPETLGFVDHIDYAADTWRDVSSHVDIVRRAKKLRVIRGAIASFFWHPVMLSPGAAAQYNLDPSYYYKMDQGRGILRHIIEGLKDLGYKFISIGDQKIFPQSFPGVY